MSSKASRMESIVGPSKGLFEKDRVCGGYSIKHTHLFPKHLLTSEKMLAELPLSWILKFQIWKRLRILFLLRIL